jgi:hypothetical protein
MKKSKKPPTEKASKKKQPEGSVKGDKPKTKTSKGQRKSLTRTPSQSNQQNDMQRSELGDISMMED